MPNVNPAGAGEPSEVDLARSLLQQVAQWRTMRGLRDLVRRTVFGSSGEADAFRFARSGFVRRPEH